MRVAIFYGFFNGYGPWLYLYFFFVTGFSGKLGAFAEKLGKKWLFSYLIYFVVFVIFYQLLKLPTEKNECVEAIPFRKLSNIGPAGSINSSINDMMKWVKLQLSEGEIQGKKLIQKETLKDMHLVHMPVHMPIFEDAFGYGLGWFTALHEGHYIVSHGGGIDGFISMVTLYPKEKLGVVVLTNSDSHGLFPTMAAYGIADLLLGKEDDSWLSKVTELGSHSTIT